MSYWNNTVRSDALTIRRPIYGNNVDELYERLLSFAAACCRPRSRFGRRSCGRGSSGST